MWILHIKPCSDLTALQQECTLLEQLQTASLPDSGFESQLLLFAFLLIELSNLVVETA